MLTRMLKHLCPYFRVTELTTSTTTLNHVKVLAGSPRIAASTIVTLLYSNGISSISAAVAG